MSKIIGVNGFGNYSFDKANRLVIIENVTVLHRQILSIMHVPTQTVFYLSGCAELGGTYDTPNQILELVFNVPLSWENTDELQIIVSDNVLLLPANASTESKQDATIATLQSLLQALNGLELSVDTINVTTDDLELLTQATNTAINQLETNNTSKLEEVRLEIEAQIVLTNQKLQELIDAQASSAEDNFKRTLKFEPNVGEEIRRDETITDDYHGIALDGSATANSVWGVVRFYKNNLGKITRTQYRTGVKWDERSVGWL